MVIGREQNALSEKRLPFPIDQAEELDDWCKKEGKNVSEIVWQNELSWRSAEQIRADAGPGPAQARTLPGRDGGAPAAATFNAAHRQNNRGQTTIIESLTDSKHVMFK